MDSYFNSWDSGGNDRSVFGNSLVRLGDVREGSHLAFYKKMGRESVGNKGDGDGKEGQMAVGSGRT